jgi:hypothetical protein
VERWLGSRRTQETVTIWGAMTNQILALRDCRFQAHPEERLTAQRQGQARSARNNRRT